MDELELSTEEKKILLDAARVSIKAEFDNNPDPEIDLKAFPKLALNLGAFVTLKINNVLRGCIGYIVSPNPLFATIVNAAKQSAFSDPRFPVLTEEEFENVKIEVSALSDFSHIKNYDEIILGKHGLLLDEGSKAILLPQVATEHNYNRNQFLTALCHKAGLYGEYWKERVLNIKIFTALVFGED